MKQKIAEFLNVFFGLRKFLAWFGLFVVGIVFRVENLIDGKQFVDLMTAAFTGFVAGNTTEHLVTVVKGYFDSKGKPVDQSENLVPVEPEEEKTEPADGK